MFYRLGKWDIIVKCISILLYKSLGKSSCNKKACNNHCEKALCLKFRCSEMLYRDMTANSLIPSLKNHTERYFRILLYSKALKREWTDFPRQVHQTCACPFSVFILQLPILHSLPSSLSLSRLSLISWDHLEWSILKHA